MPITGQITRPCRSGDMSATKIALNQPLITGQLLITGIVGCLTEIQQQKEAGSGYLSDMEETPLNSIELENRSRCVV